MVFNNTKSYTAAKSSCRLSQTITSPTPITSPTRNGGHRVSGCQLDAAEQPEVTPEYSLVSSVKLTSLDADTSLSISEIIIKNRRGPKTVPCVTILNIGWSSRIHSRQSYKMGFFS